jgi:Flp pilus assembly protein TadG
MLEFALVLPFILLLIILFIEFGRVVYYYSALNNAVREGSRYAVVQLFSTPEERLSEVQARVVGYAIWLPLDGSDVNLYCDKDTGDTDNPCDEFVTVEASTAVQPLSVFLASVFGAGTAYNLSADSTMQMTPYGKLAEEP